MKHLRSQKNCCCSHKLQLPSENRHAGKKPVQEVHRQVQSLCPQFIFFPYFHQPVYQDGTHSCCDIWLLPHVVGLGPESYLFGERVEESGCSLLREPSMAELINILYTYTKGSISCSTINNSLLLTTITV